MRSYPVIERNEMIWAWHHLEGEAPFYDVPEVPEFSDPDWLPYAIREFDVATCCQEMAENNVDFAHFVYVHGSESIPDDSFVIDGTYKRTVSLDGTFVREGFGLGLGVLHMGDDGRVLVVDHTDRRREREGPLGLHRTALVGRRRVGEHGRPCCRPA